MGKQQIVNQLNYYYRMKKEGLIVDVDRHIKELELKLLQILKEENK